MAHVTNYDVECTHCGNDKLFDDYNCNTGEGVISCSACGRYHSAYFKRNENNDIVTQDAEYLIDGSLVMAIKYLRPDKSWYTGEIPYGELAENDIIIWETPVTTDMTAKDIENFMFREIENDVIAELKSNHKDVYDITNCHKNIYHKSDGEYKQLWYIGNGFRFGTDSDERKVFILEKVEWDIEERKGYGVVYMQEKPGQDDKRQVICHEYFEKIMSPEEALSIWDSHVSAKLDFDESYLTVWDDKNNKLECLKGKIPESYDFE